MRHCPRCNGTNVSAHVTPANESAAQEEGFMCAACGLTESRHVVDPDYNDWKARWQDSRPMSYEQISASVARRAAVDDQRERDWKWPIEHEPTTWQAVSDRTKRVTKLAEYHDEKEYAHITLEGGESRYAYFKRLPQNPELFARIVNKIEDDEPRQQYAAWLRQTSDPRAPDAAEFIDTQLRIAREYRENPRATIKPRPGDRVFESPELAADWWRYPGAELPGAMSDNLVALVDEGLIADLRWFRGFVEHVTIKARRFIEIADELFSLAPIRYLTITCAKGLDNNDTSIWRAFLSSPHLSRIRSLRFPSRSVDHPLAELNRLTDSDIELLAASTQVRGLRYLEFTDANALTIGAFNALARSRNLLELSAVRHDLYRYEQLGNFEFASVGPTTQTLGERALERYRASIEKEHGPIPWLHVAEHYGSETPDLEAVVEHPTTNSSHADL